MPRLIPGGELTRAQRQQVLAAFTYRWTHENAARRYGGRCPACAQVSRGTGWPYVCGEALPHGPVSYTQVLWHADHSPVTTDEQWLRAHCFEFTNHGERLVGHYAVPVCPAAS